MLRFFYHGFILLILTLISQIGGLAWAIAVLSRRPIRMFFLLYAGLWVAVWLIAPLFGRVPIPCTTHGDLRVQSWAYCALNRNYVTPAMADRLRAAAAAMAEAYPGTQTVMLDGNFPFVTGFPLLPHLSHDDGEKADLAFYYTVDGAYRPGYTPSPIGYFAFEAGPTPCPKRWPSLRWNFQALQSYWPEAELDRDRTRALIRYLLADAGVGKIFLEPHLVDRLGVRHKKLRFQGCWAARHDDHIHIQL